MNEIIKQLQCTNASLYLLTHDYKDKFRPEQLEALQSARRRIVGILLEQWKDPNA